jgi:hypothetical protein
MAYFSKKAGYSIEWHGADFTKALRVQMRKRLLKAGGVAKRRMLSLVSRTGVTHRTSSLTRQVGGKTKRYAVGRKMIGAGRSAPGEPPRRQTGRFSGSIKVKSIINDKARTVRVKVGSTDPKAHLLEFGTKRMQARPAWFRAIQESRSEVMAILAQPFAAGELKLPF